MKLACKTYLEQELKLVRFPCDIQLHDAGT